jgi:hypothetical protein
MKQPTHGFIALAMALLTTHCANPPSIPIAKSRPSATSAITDNPARSASVPPTPKTGHYGKGLLAFYDDRDGDGIFEEAKRGDIIYFDRNGDRLADLVVQGDPQSRTIEWDTDYNGWLGQSATHEEGMVPRLIPTGPILKPAPRLFLEDHIRKTDPHPMATPGWHFWESILGLR